MEINLKRRTFGEHYTIGTLSVEGCSLSFPTVEDTVREEGVKIYGETAIPSGRYKVTLDVVSPKFSKYHFYMETCGGKLPRLIDVPNYTGVLIHCGRTEAQSAGCILLNDYNAPIERSKEYFKKFYDVISKSRETIWINIQ